MPQRVKISIIASLVFPILLWRNHHLHLTRFGCVENALTIISFVRDKRFCFKSVNQALSFLAIRSGTFCNKHSDRHTMRIHGQMYLGVEPPFVRPMA